MSGRKEKMLILAIAAGLLLVLGLFAFENDGNFLWFVPGIALYIVNVFYWAKKPPRIVFDNEKED